jgi:hypothetical protein
MSAASWTRKDTRRDVDWVVFLVPCSNRDRSLVTAGDDGDECAAVVIWFLRDHILNYRQYSTSRKCRAVRTACFQAQSPDIRLDQTRLPP